MDRDVEALSGRVVRVMGLNPGAMTLSGSCTYLVGTGERRVLVDCGQGVEGYGPLLAGAMREAGCRSLEAVLVTHHHADHVGGLAQLVELLGGREELRVLKMPGGPAPEGWMPAAGARLEPLRDGQELRVEGATLRVVHTPGHTDDHAAVWLEEERAVFSGDCVLGEGTAVFRDLHTYMRSLDALLRLEPRVLYPGHGPVVGDPVAKLRAYVDHRLRREGQLLEALRARPAGLTAMALVREVYRDTPAHLHPAACGNVLLHLGKLERDGLAERGAPDPDALRAASADGGLDPRLAAASVSPEIFAAVWTASSSSAL